MLPHLLALTLAIAPAAVSAGLFPSNSLVKHLDAKGFRQALKENRTSVIAFVAPWCGHCQRMAPELSKAALGLYPLIPTYAVDCDDAKNRQVCAEQGVKGFPTVKLFPRGKDVNPITFEGGERTASAFYYWATRRVPNKNKKLYHLEDIEPWVTKNIEKNRVLLLNKGKTVPLLWQVLGNKYKDQLEFSSHRDRKGKTGKALGVGMGGKKESRVLVYPAGSTSPVIFEGILKHDSLSKFFDSVIDGSADLKVVNAQAKDEEFALTEEELEIERQQEAQRIALAHGGFTEMIDFEEAVKKYGTDFHDAHGYGGMMGEMPKKKDAAAAAEEGAAKQKKEEDPIHKILKHQQEREKEKERAQRETTPKTGDGGQIVFEAKTETGHRPTGAAQKPKATESAGDAPSESAETPAPPAESTAASTSDEEAGHVKDEL